MRFQFGSSAGPEIGDGENAEKRAQAWRRAAYARLGVTPEGLRALKFNAATLRIAGNHVRRLIAGARRGDQARDARRWAEAVRAYRAGNQTFAQAAD